MANTKLTVPLNTKTEENTEMFSVSLPVNKRSITGHQLHNNIILSNYENITHLEVTENNIEYLDLSTLKKLETLLCRRNRLNKLTLNGESLISLTASYNDLTRISVAPAPGKLRYLDLRHNKLHELPQWLDKCHQLQSLHANNNLLEELPSHLINSERLSLHTLYLDNNKLKSLPNISNEKIHLRELCVHCNQLRKLPDNLFFACNELITLNISNNKLETLPIFDKSCSRIERLFTSKNYLGDMVLKTVLHLKKLRILHAAYNNLTSLPSECISNWSELEELVLSGNKLKCLPENISSLKYLKVLRLHSNQLRSIPDLSKINTLRVIDLAHNDLGRINMFRLLPKNAQFLDLSCNRQLQVDSGQLKSFQSGRKISFVDVSGKNRSSLPTSAAFEHHSNTYTPWKVGFSETPGNRHRLYISQLRLPHFCNTDGLFGMFAGEIKTAALGLLPKIIPTILLQHHTVHSTTADYMKHTLISAYKEINQNDHTYGECAILVHLTKEKQSLELATKHIKSRKYILRAAMAGGIRAYLIRKQGSIHISSNSSKKQFDNVDSTPTSVLDATIFEISLSNDDEYLVIGSKKVWETMEIETVVQEIRREEDVILAAKRLQDVAQSFGVEDNISVIILKFQNVEAYVNLLIHELRQEVRRKTGLCKLSGCCYSTDGNLLGNQLCEHSGRSSQIEQTDQEISELSAGLKRITSDTYCFAESGISSFKLQSESDESEQNVNETDSVLSEEQFKCWEYMLEQNTQLLFDKELNKISNNFTENSNSACSINIYDGNNSSNLNLLRAANKTQISASFPQLISKDTKQYPSFTSKRSSAARSFQKFSSSQATNVSSSENICPTAGGGVNVGYFGSLQHFTLYNFENDFAVTHERQIGDESLEYASRMSKYWGVATTEL